MPGLKCVEVEVGKLCTLDAFTYMRITTASASTMNACYENLKEDVLIFKEKGTVVLLYRRF